MVPESPTTPAEIELWLARPGEGGELAELEIGPVARNIHGARLAGRRLLDAVG
ncbi:MAG: hypothetical protein HC897_06720 [Thermoanaerobaculia bacterium]|nr:hypothetical protein [Thermoanaerobaculia bacterium]